MPSVGAVSLQAGKGIQKLHLEDEKPHGLEQHGTLITVHNIIS